MNLNAFDVVRRAIGAFLKRYELDDFLEFEDQEIKELFVLICEAVDHHAPEYWVTRTKGYDHRVFVKKMAAVFCSKIANDNAYRSVFKGVMKALKESDLFDG